MLEFPLQVIDDFLLDYHVGHALILVFVLALVGGYVVNRSTKVVGLQLSLFGLLFIILPNSMMTPQYTLFGIALAVVGPVIFISAKD
jgi:hypothetical protein